MKKKQEGDRSRMSRAESFRQRIQTRSKSDVEAMMGMSLDEMKPVTEYDQWFESSWRPWQRFHNAIASVTGHWNPLKPACTTFVSWEPRKLHEEEVAFWLTTMNERTVEAPQQTDPMEEYGMAA